MKILKDKSIVTFCGKDREYVAVVLGLDDLMRGPKTPHGAVFEFDSAVAQEFSFFELALVGIAYMDHTSETIVTMDELGNVRLLQHGEINQESFEPTRGPMRALKRIDNKLFASGISSQVFQRQSSGQWLDISPPPPLGDVLRLSMLESIDGYSAGEIYAAADNGIIWYYDGQTWDPVQTSTNLAYYSVHCGDDGMVYAVGQLGILAKGRGNKFEILPQTKNFSDLWGVAHYKDKLYVVSMRAMMTLDPDNLLVPVLDAMELGFSFYGLDIVDDVLWSVGEKDILKLDGDMWSRFVDPSWIQ